ncbi:MAG: tetratricopeptide repeat protein [Chloroflexi bacterium]|nr:tetratricopeptide repeat protein [Chloroflexota bacterium]
MSGSAPKATFRTALSQDVDGVGAERARLLEAWNATTPSACWLDTAATWHSPRATWSQVFNLRPSARVAALNNLALLRGANKQPERGLELLEDALEVCKLLGDRHQEAALLTNAADLLRAAGRTSEAIERVKSAVAILADIGGELSSLQPEIWKLSEW